MDFEQIMCHITSGLTGDIRKDIIYLQKEMQEYKNHEMSTEILRACGRLLYGMIPEAERGELSRAVFNDVKGMEAALDEIRYNVYKKEFKKAEQMLVAIINKIEKAPMFQNDKVSEYYTFNEAFEEILYRHLYKPDREIRRAEIPYADIYLQYGSLLFELKRYQEARKALEKAVRWNPISLKIAFEYMETFKVVGALEEFASLTKNAFKHAYRSKDLARCYRNMGYYFVEKMEYRVAMGCYILSMQYDRDSRNAQSELYYIQTKTDGTLKQPNAEEMEQYSKTYDFPLGADDDIVGLSYAYGKHFMDEGDTELARYFLRIVYELTEDGEVKEILDEFSSKY